MTYRGHIENVRIELDEPAQLPEGAEVSVSMIEAALSGNGKVQTEPRVATMSVVPGQVTPSGVFEADDFRDNLIIDRYDPCFLTMRSRKRKHLRSENSEDAVTWNVFRSLRQLRPVSWFPALFDKGFPELKRPRLSDEKELAIELWKSVSAPPSLLVLGDERSSEIDIVLESPWWVWFIEAKYKSDISERTTTRHDRDQIIRNLDVGSFYAGVREFYFALLVLSEDWSEKGVKKIEQYKDYNKVRERLSHRADKLSNLHGVGLLRWADIVDILNDAKVNQNRPEESIIAERVLQWLHQRGIRGNLSSP